MIRLNGRDIDDADRRYIGYVEQVDHLFPHATVLEAVTFSAYSRLPRAASSRRASVIHGVFQRLELSHIANQRVESLTSAERR